jgi:hypothetical protein
MVIQLHEAAGAPAAQAGQVAIVAPSEEPAGSEAAAPATGSAGTEVAASPAAEPTAEPNEPVATPAEPAAAPPPATAEPAAPAAPAQPSQPAGWRNPWLRDTPAALRAIRKAVMDGSSGNDRMIATLRKYNRTAEHDDARGHLLLARMYLNRGWRDDALNQYATAIGVDPSSRGAPKVLSDLLTLVANGKSSRDAARFVRVTYGTEALREIDRALVTYKDDANAVVRLKSLRTTITG